MTTTDTIPAMPDLHCPSWCERDHDADWRMHVAVGRDTRPIPTTDGGLLYPDTTRPESEWLELFEPFHLRTLATVAFTAPNEHATIDLQRGAEADAGLYIDARGDITAEDARAFAAELLKAADLFERLTTGASAPVLDDRGQAADLDGYEPQNR